MGIFNFRKQAGRPRNPVVIYIAEDNVLYSKQLEFYLQNKFGKSVTIQTFPVSEVIEVKLEHGHIPNVIIMDHNLSDRYEDAAFGLESLKTIHGHYPQILLILHAMQGNNDLAEAAATGGAFTYISKGSDAFARIEALIAPLVAQQEVR